MKLQLAFVNRTGKTLRLRLEPYGEAYEVTHGSSVDVRADGPETPSGPSIEVDEQGAVVFHAWTGATMSFHSDGVPLAGSGLIDNARKIPSR